VLLACGDVSDDIVCAHAASFPYLQPSPHVRPDATPGTKRGVSTTPGAASTGTPTPGKSLLKRKSFVAATPQAARRRRL
jgi:hypothetical protein